MNRLSGTVAAVESSAAMSLVEVDVEGDIFSSLVLETSRTNPDLVPGRRIGIFFKETEVSIAKNLSGQISLRNRMNAVVKKIEPGKILTKIFLDYKGNEIISIITTKSSRRMDLKEGDAVEALVKTTEVSLWHTI